MNYKKINNITGWAIGLIACAVYLMTMEATVSFWDCGEFAAGAAKLEVVHSPGAPLFLLIGRLFTILFGGLDNAHIALNSLSALSSGFTILFLFWTITHFAKRIALRQNEDAALSQKQIIGIMSAGIVGALAYTFSDTFWFSAVEAEVYAMSSFLTALVFWAILKWEDKLTEGDKGADRWIIFIAFVIGLSIGVHLLNLLTIPAIVMVYYFKKRNVTPLGTLIAFAIGCAITGIIQVGVIQFIPYLCAKFDVLFVNSFGAPFNSGVYFVLAILAALSAVALIYAKRSGKYFLHLGTLCFVFILIGYSSYFQTVIRSNADVPIDMTNPDNAFSLVSYLGREQYGSIPHLKGPDFTSRATGYAEGSMEYYKGEDKYEELGEKRKDLEYAPGEERIFPRVWDANDPNHVRFYQNYLGLSAGEKPSAGDNVRFFMGYQVNQMWWRYFCWNYIGRQNDIQNIFGEPQHSNWLSGVKFIDKAFGRGDMDKAPAMYSESKARNELYFLPFILGIIGLIFHIQNDKRNAFIVGLLFFFTGLAIVIYLNNTPIQPRERDYAYAGATYAFAIWIGLGVLMIEEWLRKFLKGGTMSTIAAAGICLLAVPALMAFKGWDDHDRSDKTLAMDTAKNYLQSLDKGAILFTEGDNDTYPLWYAQEIDGLRPDVRIINLSLLGIDWYIDQLNWAVNEAGNIPMIWKPTSYRGDKLNYVQYQAAPGLDANRYYDLKQVLQFVEQQQNPMGASALPLKNFTLPVNKDNIVKSQILKGRDSLLAQAGETINFTYPRDVAYKNDLALLNILAANDWKRPIYFANSIDQNHYEGLGEYLELEGLVFKLVPYRTPGSNTITPLSFNEKKSQEWVLNQAGFGNAHKGTVYYNQTNRRMLNGIRIATFHIAENLIRRGKKKEAIKVLDHMLKNIHEKSYPIALSQEDKALILIADSYIKAGATKQATALSMKLADYATKMAAYFKTLKSQDQQAGSPAFAEADFGRTALGYLINNAKANNMPALSDSLNKAFAEINQLIPATMPQMPQQ